MNVADDLSELFFVDCGYEHFFHDESGTWGAWGCDGTWPQAYLDFLTSDHKGQHQTEAAYPYRGNDYGGQYCYATDEG